MLHQTEDQCSLTSRHFIVADDEPMMANLIGSILLSNWPRAWITTASDGRRVMRILETDTRGVDAVILDMLMPEMDGIETLIVLRDQFPKVGVVAVTGGLPTVAGNVPLLDMARHLGAPVCLAKPFATTELVHAVELALRAVSVRKEGILT